MSATIREYRPEDAAAVARLFQASDAGWPTGFGDGVLLPAEDIGRELEVEERALNRYLAWDGDRAVGYADLVPKYDDEKAGYLGLLTADPSYHGRGVGRDLIRTIVRRCVELGLHRLTLDTWSGNTRAVPLYKKTGFWWGPEDEELQNHVPLLLSHPLTKPYFERNDWYQCLRRDPSLGLDKATRNGALVFPYEWEGAEGRLRAVFDQKTKKPVELETPDLLISIETDAPELVRGREIQVRMKLENRQARPMLVGISSSGDGQVTADFSHVLQIDFGATQTLAFKAGAKGDDTGDGAVKVTALIDDHGLEMAASLKVLPPIELTLEPSAPVVRTSEPAWVTLNVRNRLGEPATLELVPASADALTVVPASRTIELGPNETTGVQVEVLARTAGAHRLTLGPAVRRGDTVEQQSPESAQVAAVEPGGVVGVRDGKEVRLVSEHLALHVPTKGTEISLRDRYTGKPLGAQELHVGPPFWPSRHEEQESVVAVEHGPGRATVTSQVELKEPQGVRFERVLTMYADGKVTSAVTLTNLASEDRTVQIRTNTRPSSVGRSSYVPLREGVVRGEGNLPGWTWSGPGSEPPLAGRWIAVDLDGWTLGVLWPEVLRAEIYHEMWNRLRTFSPEKCLAPGESYSPGAFVLLPTRAGWREVQRAWKGDGRSGQSSEVISAVGARVRPSPVLISGERAEAIIEARSYYPRPTDATVEIQTPRGFAVEPSSLSFQAVSSIGPQETSVSVSARGAERLATEIEVASNFPLLSERSAVPVIVLGSAGGKVRMEETEDGGERVWRVDNGWMSFGVRPSVLGAVYSLRTPDGELLYSNFPQPAPRQWSYPVYGGILPLLREPQQGWSLEGMGRFGGQTFDAEPVEHQGPQGIRWRGVRLGADAAHEKLLGLRYELEYLTVPGGNVLAILATVRSLGPSRRVEYRLEVYPGNEPEMPRLVFPDHVGRTRGHVRGGTSVEGDRWVSAEYPGTGRNLVLVTAEGDGLLADDTGVVGLTLEAGRTATVPSCGEIRACHYVAVAADRRQAELYGALSDVVIAQ